MYAILEKFGLTADIALVAVMFVTLFAGYTAVGYAAILAFVIVSLALVVGQYNDQFVEEA